MKKNNAQLIEQKIRKKVKVLHLNANPNKLKILVYDIESAGINAFNADLGWVICFGYKWLNDKETHCLSITDYPEFEINPHNDKYLLQDALKILSEADVLVAHYGDKFDLPFINSRLLIHGLHRIPPLRQIDTCKISWNNLKLSSSRLANLAKVLKCKNQKTVKHNGWPNWWFDIIKGSTKSIKQMMEYCKQDVRTLEEIALKLQAFWPTFINQNVVTAAPGCSKCGAPRLQKYGYKITPAGKFQRYMCSKCGGYSHDTENLRAPGKILKPI